MMTLNLAFRTDTHIIISSSHFSHFNSYLIESVKGLLRESSRILCGQLPGHLSGLKEKNQNKQRGRQPHTVPVMHDSTPAATIYIHLQGNSAGSNIFLSSYQYSFIVFTAVQMQSDVSFSQGMSRALTKHDRGAAEFSQPITDCVR